MYSLSNNDFAMVVRLLKSFSQTKGNTLREVNERRVAYLLHNKLKKRSERERSLLSGILTKKEHDNGAEPN